MSEIGVYQCQVNQQSFYWVLHNILQRIDEVSILTYWCWTSLAVDFRKLCWCPEVVSLTVVNLRNLHILAFNEQASWVRQVMF